MITFNTITLWHIRLKCKDALKITRVLNITPDTSSQEMKPITLH